MYNQFLSDRWQCVSVKGSSSTWKPVDSGVPQCSVLGPQLFILYVNDISDIVKSSVLIFADDTKLFASTDQNNTLQDDLRTLLEWAELWEMTFIVLKCKIIHYGLNNSEHEYTMNNQQLKPVEEECDLGVTFSRDFKGWAPPCGC